MRQEGDATDGIDGQHRGIDYSKKLNEFAAELFVIGTEVYKKKTPICIGQALDVETKVLTLEGEEVALPGYRIVTGIKGEKYAIDPEVFNQYEEVDIGKYAKNKVIVRMIKLEQIASVYTSWGAMLTGKAGDYLVMKSIFDIWIVDEVIFHETYAFVNEA